MICELCKKEAELDECIGLAKYGDEIELVIYKQHAYIDTIPKGIRPLKLYHLICVLERICKYNDVIHYKKLISKFIAKLL